MLAGFGIEGEPDVLAAEDVGVFARRLGRRSREDRDSTLRSIRACDCGLELLLEVASCVVVLGENDHPSVVPFGGVFATFSVFRKIGALGFANPLDKSNDATVG